jgi:hypothetical protein
LAGTREPSVDPRLERQFIALDERHRGRGDDGLGHRSETKQRIDPHFGAGLALGETGRVLISELAAMCDQHDRSDDSVLAQRACDHGVDVGLTIHEYGHAITSGRFAARARRVA